MSVFNEIFMRYALLAGCICGGLLSFLGVYVILKRIVFVGIALSEIAALGVAFGFFLGINPELLSIVFAVLGVLFFWVPLHEKTLPHESILGFAYCLAAALIILVVAKSPMIEAAGVDLISGNLLYVSPKDIISLFALACIVLAVNILLFKKMLFCSFDMETAQALGLKAKAYDFVIYLTIGISIALSVRVTGILFSFGSLIIAPMAALVLFRNLKIIFAASILFTVLSVFAGLLISYHADLPTAPTIVAIYCLVFILAGFYNFFRPIFVKFIFLFLY